MSERLDLVVLAGGAATRMGPACAQTPKALLPVGGVPFLVYALETMGRTAPLRRVIICARTGQRDAFMRLSSLLPYPLNVIEETAPLGTGGAILAALDSTPLGDPFIVMNGDVFFDMDAAALAAAARANGAAVAAVMVPNAARFGTLALTRDNMVYGFHEKTGAATPGIVSAGAYAFTHESLRGFPRGGSSFETDIAPALARRGMLAAVHARGALLDIGTPETYEGAAAFITAQSRRNGRA